MKYLEVHQKLEKIQERERNRRFLAQAKSCGKGVGLRGKMRITGIEQVTFGDNVHIGDNAFIRAEGGLVIGDNTHISRNLVLYTINHRFDGTRIPYDEELIEKPVFIGKNVWIGMNVCITPGTIIEDGAIVGMGTTVTGRVPRLSIIGGPKWRVLAERDAELYGRLDEQRAHGGPSGIAL